MHKLRIIGSPDSLSAANAFKFPFKVDTGLAGLETVSWQQLQDVFTKHFRNISMFCFFLPKQVPIQGGHRACRSGNSFMATIEGCVHKASWNINMFCFFSCLNSCISWYQPVRSERQILSFPKGRCQRTQKQSCLHWNAAAATAMSSSTELLSTNWKPSSVSILFTSCTTTGTSPAVRLLQSHFYIWHMEMKRGAVSQPATVCPYRIGIDLLPPSDWQMSLANHCPHTNMPL